MFAEAHGEGRPVSPGLARSGVCTIVRTRMGEAMHNRRKSLRYRPGIGGNRLEGRVVLSTSSGTQVGFWGFRNFLIGNDRPFLYTQYAQPSLAPMLSVGANYNTQFLAGYFDAMNASENAGITYLGNIGDTTARGTFDTAVTGALDALTAQLTSQLVLIGPASKNLQTTVQQLILGSGSTSLASILKSLPDPATGVGTDFTAFQNKITYAFATSRTQVIADLNVFLNSHHLSGPSFFTTVSGHAVTQASVAQQSLKVIQNAFAGFANDYALGAGPWLTGTDPTTIATNRTAFDLNTQSAINSLTSTLTSNLALTPGAATDLIPAIQERLLGVTGLIVQLDNLANPTDLSGTSAAAFGNDAAAAISVAYNDIGKLYTEFAHDKTIPATVPTSYNDGFGGGFSGFGNGYIPQASPATPVGLNFVPTFLQGYGFTNTLLGLGANGSTFVYGTTQYGQSNGLSLTTGFNEGFNAGFTTVTGLNYKQVGTIKTGLL